MNKNSVEKKEHNRNFRSKLFTDQYSLPNVKKILWFLGNEDVNKAIKWLIDFTKNEIYTIRLCHECYWNANHNRNDWFTMSCTKPHLLIWAKQKGFPYWPAKLMAINREKRTIDVQFFGQHERLVFTSKDPVCYIFSKENPSSIIGPSKVSLDEDIYVSFPSA